MVSATKRDPTKRLRESSREAAEEAVRRLKELLDDPDTSHADVLKAAALIFDRVYPAAAAEKEAGGDYEICVKGE
ncbi:MAG: hypothetical protein GX637_00255 [Clostridiales bacterium]|nr:hypothetical protein [Clostridiales bacterium]